MSSNDTLSDRLSFMKLSPEAQQHQRTIKPIVMDQLPATLDAFYAQVQAFAETRKFFSSQSQMSGAKSRQLAHWGIISSGQFDQGYVRAVTDIDKAGRAMCQLAGLCQAQRAWDWVAVDLHINALKLLRSLGASLGARERAAVLDGLRQVTRKRVGDPDALPA